MDRHREHVKSGYDAKVGPAALQSPEQIAILCAIGIDNAAIAQDDLEVLDIVCSSPEFP